MATYNPKPCPYHPDTEMIEGYCSECDPGFRFDGMSLLEMRKAQAKIDMERGYCIWIPMTSPEDLQSMTESRSGFRAVDSERMYHLPKQIIGKALRGRGTSIPKKSRAARRMGRSFPTAGPSGTFQERAK